MNNSNVRPRTRKLTDMDARHLLAEGLIRTCHGPGPQAVAVEAGCDEKTVRRARDEETTLRLDFAVNILDMDPHVLDPLLAAKGYMLVPLEITTSRQTIDVIPAAGAAIHRIGQARMPQSDGGAIETDLELIESEGEIDALFAAVLERRAEIANAKLRRAGLSARAR